MAAKKGVGLRNRHCRDVTEGTPCSTCCPVGGIHTRLAKTEKKGVRGARRKGVVRPSPE